MISSEMAPLIKTGGLGDVVGALPVEFKKRGCDVRVVIPKYADCSLDGYHVEKAVEPMGVWMGTGQEWCSVFGVVTESGIPVYLIEHHLFFSRPGLYHDAGMNDYHDNPRRFGFFTRAALQLCRDIDFRPDIIHAHDWQTALAPAYLKVWDWDSPVIGKAASVLTIHNAAYQGIYPKAHYDYLGLGWRNFAPNKFEAYDNVHFLKGGIQYADVVNTVSPGYAREISTPYSPYGLAPLLADRGENFFGILNGVDYEHWSPERDRVIPERYSPGNMEGKRTCKRALQRSFRLEERGDMALVGAIGRFVRQKGYHLAAMVIDSALQHLPFQFVILGTGDSGLERFFGELPGRRPGRAGSYIGFSNDLAHLISSGCDFFLMPSLNEPCGLNQMYSLRYGTLPIVHATGGLDDTVVNYDETTGSGTGFKFYDATPDALYHTLEWAIRTYYDRPKHMKQLIAKAMAKDFSWVKSAGDYLQAYERAIENKKRYDALFQ